MLINCGTNSQVLIKLWYFMEMINFNCYCYFKIINKNILGFLNGYIWTYIYYLKNLYDQIIYINYKNIWTLRFQKKNMYNTGIKNRKI